MSYDPKFSNVSLLLHMDGDNNSTTFLDASPTPEIVIASGDVKVSTAHSKFGGASAYFDGTGDYLSIPATPDLELGSGDGTIELWFRATSAPATAGGLIQRPNSSGYANFSLNYRPSGALEAYCSLSNPATLPVILAPTGVVTIGQWHHIAFVKSGLTYTLYVDGVRKASGTAASHPPTGLTTQTFIGALSASTFFVDGHIDELRVTKGVARYTANFTPPTRAFDDRGPRFVGKVRDRTGALASRTVRAYRRDTGALLGSAVPRDTTGDAYRRFVSLMLHMDGANNSTVFTDAGPAARTVTPSGNAKISTTASKFGGSAGYFDGTGDYLSIPNNEAFDFGAGDFTIECWVRLSTVTGNHHILSKYQTSATCAFALYQTASQIGFYSSSNGTTWNLVSNLTFGTGLSIDTWYHLAVTRSGTTVKTFRDGVAIASTTVSGAVFASSESVLVGRGNNGSPSEFAGYIDELRITKGIARYTSAFTPPTAPYPDYDNSAALNEYVIETPGYTGEAQVVCLDDAADILENDLIHRAFPKHKYSLNVGAFELRVNGEPILFS